MSDNQTEQTTVAEQKAEQAGFLGSGWSFPPTFEVGNFQLEMVAQQNSINQSIDVILQTRQGERPLQPLFGSILHSFVFRSFNAMLQNEVTEAVKVALRDFEPRIKVDKVIVSANNDEGSLLSIHINYTVRQTNSRHNHVYPFALNEATHLSLNGGGL